MAAAWSCAQIIDHARRETSMTRPGFLDNSRVIDWLGDVEPAWTSLTYERVNALQQEPSSTNTALHLASDLTVNEFNAPRSPETGCTCCAKQRAAAASS
jgi:hypothetical protein